MFLPKKITKLKAPPVKCQGIKTKLVPFIAESIAWEGNGRWIEPFFGSGVVGFNLRPDRAILSDTNIHIIKFYKDIQKGEITPDIVRSYLQKMGKELSKNGEKLYYEIRKEFNSEGGSLKFIFLNRSCFNGMMRFNSKGEYNVPFGHKPERFAQAYITKIANQIEWVSGILYKKDWEFRVCDWREALNDARPNDFAYLDPPYIGRHTDYYNGWTEKDAIDLSTEAKLLPCGFALSMWLENKYRKNGHIDQYWDGLEIKQFNHFYHIGSTESLRNEMIEALVIKQGFVNNIIEHKQKAEELAIPLFA